MIAGLLMALIIPSPRNLPALSAQCALAIDADTGKVLWSRNAEVPAFPASTTKVMTALLLLERSRPDELILADGDTQNVDGASLHLKLGERIRADQILYAMLLRSANDACVAVAKHISGSVPKFVDLMNARARELGCENTHFANPNGLPDPNHTISAHDMARIARQAMTIPAFRAVVRQRRHNIARSINQLDRTMVSKNHYLALDPTADGIKTGYTKAAGHCYVGSATRDAHRVITVIFGSADWKADQALLLNTGFSQFGHEVVAKAGTLTRYLPITGTLKPTIRAANQETIFRVNRKGHPTPLSHEFIPAEGLAAPLARGARVGTLVVTDSDGFVQQIPFVAIEDSGLATPSAQSLPHMAFTTLFVSGVYLLRRKSRRTLSDGKKTPRRPA